MTLSAVTRYPLLLVVLLACTATHRVFAMGEEAFGPAGEHISRSNDWPKGVEDVLRHPSRVYWNWVNGNEHAYFVADFRQMNELIDYFSKLTLQEHRIVLRAGQPTTKSFQGLVVNYNVHFEVSSGIYLHHVRQHAATGLYSSQPQLTIYIDSEMATRLEDLQFPASVTLQADSFRVEDALAQLKTEDPSLQWHAITLLGECSDASEKVTNRLQELAQDQALKENIRVTAQTALAKLEQARSPEGLPLRELVAGFLRNHPQRNRVLHPGEILKKLQLFDGRYAEGFTARGTMSQASLSGHDSLTAWTITMGNGRLVIQSRAMDRPGIPPAEDLLENTIFVSPTRMATIHQSRLWVDGQLLESKPFVTFEPVGSTYDLLIGRMLWPLGRGYCRRVDAITAVAANSDGTLEVTGQSNLTGLAMRWELRVDPTRDYLIRSAKCYFRDETSPTYMIENAGSVAGSGRLTAHTATWLEGPAAQKVSIAVNDVTNMPDLELIEQTEQRLETLPSLGQQP